jgi:HYR domain/Membrane dipeptidase (Peptidase family M19)
MKSILTSLLSLRQRWQRARRWPWSLAALLFVAALLPTAASAQVLASPVTIACPADILAEGTGPEGAVVTFQVTAGSTAGSIISVTCLPPSGSVFPLGNTTVRCTALDSLRNSVSCAFTVTVRDTQPPVLAVPAPIEIACAPAAGLPVDFTVTATDVCDTNVIPVCTPSSGSLFPAGLTTVRCQARDGSGNLAVGTFTVTVLADTNPPVLTVPETIQAACTGPDGAVVVFDVTALDDCDGAVPVSCSPPSGSVFPIGTTTVVCTARDSQGNAASGAFVVDVTGNCGPDCLQIRCPRDIEVNLGSGRGIFTSLFGGQPAITVDFNVTATNVCGGSNVIVECTPPSGSLFTLGTHVVNCYAEAGVLHTTCSFQVSVTDTTPPTVTVPRSLYVSCNEKRGDGTEGAVVNYTVHATDNAGPPSTVCMPPTGSFFPVGRTVVECVATDAAGNKATNSFSVTVTESLYCSLKSTLEEMPDNWGFELGLTAWEPEGDAFFDQPVEGDRMPVKRVKDLATQIANDIGGDYWREVAYPVGHQGDRWIGTAENIDALPGGLFDNAPTEERTGTLRSKSFLIEKPYISFLIGGTKDEAHLRAELLIQADAAGPDTETIDGLAYQVWASFTGHDHETMRWEQFAVYNQMGKRAVIRIVDHSTTGHLNVDDFRFENTPRLFQTVKVGGKTYPAWVKYDGDYYRWDSPTWGFADLHTHPMSYLGFGKAVLRGEPDGNITTALENCRCFHGIPDFDNPCGDFMRGLVMSVMEDGLPGTHGNGYSSDVFAQFNAWPVFWTIEHQQMWHEWVKRAHDGGLRVIVALCVNNPMLAVGAKGEKDNDDKFVSDVQIDGLIDFVNRHSDFMEIALDPFQLRDIVRRNKLAVIIGSELDDIGNFARYNLVHQWNVGDPFSAPSAADKNRVRQEIDRLYNKGLRYMFPVHLMNNSFGGTAVGNNMLNVANKFLNHRAFDIEAGTSDDKLNVYLDTLDYTDTAALISAGALVAPAVIPLVLPFADAILASVGVPPGTGAAVGAGILPLAIMGTTALPLMGIELNQDGIPLEVLPLFHQYPDYHQKGESGWDWGHKNAKGLTPLGEFAIKEMMKRGIMIDVDHMSQNTLVKVFKMATNNPVGYPLNSGHNSPRVLDIERGENSRTLDQLHLISQLGGLYGVGWENSKSRPFAGNAPSHSYTHSDIPNDCAGTSKTYAQYYLYGVEAMHGRGIAFGTDIDGVIPTPGPRFGPQSAFALGDDPLHERKGQVWAQDNGVRYTSDPGRPITTPAFMGRAIDSGVNTTYPRTELGYAYNREQGDLFAAIRIFHYREKQVENGTMNQQDVQADLDNIVNAMYSGYPDRRRIREYTVGLLDGIHNWPVGSDLLYTDTESLQKIGKALYESKVLHTGLLPQYVNTSALKPRFERAVTVWNHYHRIFGDNTPLKPCRTGFKEWDINFEGVAHYGLVPDFLQDLTNVGMDPEDLSVLFQSADSFAQMWVKTLNAADAINHPIMHLPAHPVVTRGLLQLEWFAEEGDQLEETDRLGDPSSWHPSSAEVSIVDERAQAAVRIDANSSPRFFRVRKP